MVMKVLSKLIFGGLAAGALLLCPTTTQAHSYDTDDSDHPLRYVIYPIHAVGKGLEYAVTRPIHYGVSGCKSRYIFGHVSHPSKDDYWGDWDLYQRYSY
jgi:hypothetical protein